MRKKYSILRCIIIIESVYLLILRSNGIKIQSWIGNAILALIYLLPILRLLFLQSKDSLKSPKVQLGCKIGFWVVIVSYILGLVATGIELLMSAGIIR